MEDCNPVLERGPPYRVKGGGSCCGRYGWSAGGGKFMLMCDIFPTVWREGAAKSGCLFWSKWQIRPEALMEAGETAGCSQPCCYATRCSQPLYCGTVCTQHSSYASGCSQLATMVRGAPNIATMVQSAPNLATMVQGAPNLATMVQGAPNLANMVRYRVLQA
jgi:hypothetical protein